MRPSHDWMAALPLEFLFFTRMLKEWSEDWTCSAIAGLWSSTA